MSLTKAQKKEIIEKLKKIDCDEFGAMHCTDCFYKAIKQAVKTIKDL